MLYLLASVVTFLLVVLVVGFFLSAPKYQGPQSDHFNGKKFINSGGVAAKGMGDLLKWATNRDPGPWTKITKIPLANPIFAQLGGKEASITFVNHSTFLIQIAGLNILTDPVWSQRVSPFSFAGPKRMRPPGIPLEQLPPIDAIIISHNHYDHLDINTIKKLYQEHKPQIIVPLGVASYLNHHNVAKVTEMDWWNRYSLSPALKLHAVPAQHFSGRGIFDRDATLWCGYILEFQEQHIYFAGDTGYGDFVQEVSARFQPMKVALLPIGAYLPTWFMSPIHTSPRDAVRMHLDLQAQQSVGIHFGTFPLADDGMEQPIDDLVQALEDLGVPPEKFQTLKNGGSLQFTF